MITVRKFLVIAVLLLLLAACGGGEEEAAPTVPAPVAPVATTAPAIDPTTAPEAPSAPEAAQAAPVAGDPLEAVTTAMQTQLSGGPFRATTTVESDGTVTEMLSEVIPPATMHVVIGGGNMEMILLDGALWTKSGETPWTQMGSPDMMDNILSTIQGEMDGSTMSNVQFVGEEPVLGEATRVFAFTSTIGEGEGVITSEAKLWISNESGLPVRMESNSVGMGVTTKTIQTIEYDDTISIEAPAP